MKAYSLDLRERIVASVQSGSNYSQAAKQFGVSVPTVSRYVKQFAQTKSLAPRFAPGAKPRLDPLVWRALEKHIQETPHATIADHQHWLKEQHGIALCHSAVHANLVRRGYTHEKRRSVPANATKPKKPSAKRFGSS